MSDTALISAVLTDLDRWSIPADGALAVSALDLATRLSDDKVHPRDAAALHAQLRATLGELAKVAKPAAEVGDPVDELQARRDERRKGA